MIEDEVEGIDNRVDLARFIQRLKHDLEVNEDEWENPDLPRFLDALGGWIESMPGYFKNRGEELPDEPDWKLVGIALLAARSYE